MDSNVNDTNQQGTQNKVFDIKVSWREKIAYGFGDVGTNLDKNMVSTFALFFFTDFLGINPGICSIIIMASRVADAFSDIGMGMIIDRTKSRFGKARSWLLRIVVPYALGPVLLFTVPPFGMTGRIIWAVLTYNLVSTVLATMYSMPYGTLTSLITQNQHERSLINILRMTGGISASIIVGFATLPMVDSFGGGSRGWQLTNLCFGGLAAICILIVFFNTKERVTSSKREKIQFGPAVKSLFKNKYWVMALLISLLTQLIIGFLGMNVYYAKCVLNDVSLVSIFTLIYFVPNFIGFVIIVPLLKRYGKRNVVLAGFAFYGLFTLCLQLAGTEDVMWILAFVALRGLAIAPLVASIFAFVYDTIEYGEWKFGKRNEGLSYSAARFGQKFGLGFGSALVAWILQYGHYDPTAAVQAQTTVDAVTFAFIWVPFICYALTALILVFWKIDKLWPQIMSDLKVRHAGADPDGDAD